MQTVAKYPHPAGVSAYQKLGVQTAVESASAHRLIEMLLDGALSRIAIARGCLQRGDIPGKCQNVGLAVSIVDGLRASLNLDAGGDLAGRLRDLYLYLNERLTFANLHNDDDMLEEAQKLLHQVRAGWVGIRDRADSAVASRAISP